MLGPGQVLVDMVFTEGRQNRYITAMSLCWHRRLQSCVGTRQDLATLHLIHNCVCGKRILSLHCALRASVHAYAIGIFRANV